MAKKKEGFAYVLVVIALAIILAIFFNYATLVRAGKGIVTVSKTNSGMQKSIQDTISMGIYEGYILDQMITENKGLGLKKNIDYLLLKNTGNYPEGTLYGDKVKVWEEEGNSDLSPWKIVDKNNIGGEWSEDYEVYVGGVWNYSAPKNYSNGAKISRGGFVVTSITAITASEPDGKVIYTANPDGTYKSGYTGDPIQTSLEKDFWDVVDNRNFEPVFKVMFFKNLLLTLDKDGKVIRDYEVRSEVNLEYGKTLVYNGGNRPEFETEKYSRTQLNEASSNTKIQSFEMIHIGP